MRTMSAATKAAGRPLPEKGPCAALSAGRCGSSTAKLLRCMSPKWHEPDQSCRSADVCYCEQTYLIRLRPYRNPSGVFVIIGTLGCAAECGISGVAQKHPAP